MKDLILHAFAIYILFVLKIRYSAAEDVSLDVTKLSDFPYMAFLYYPDETVTRNHSGRFFQNAILIKPDWLISASLEIGKDTFPVKTLMARTGVVIVDRNFTLNEDYNEQEREIIEVVVPKKYNVSMKWATDISLLKTLLPFNVTTAVTPATLNPSFKSSQKFCKILAFLNNQGLERKLVQVTIELLPSADCGNQLVEETMICGSEADLKPEFKLKTNSEDFCQDNAGGPLICDDEIVGIQIYSEKGTCNPPRLYHLLSKWNKFINCGIHYNCKKDICDGMCDAIPKDGTIDKTITISSTSGKTIEILDSDKSTKMVPVFRTQKLLEEQSITTTSEINTTITTEKATDGADITKLKHSNNTSNDIPTATPEVITTTTTPKVITSVAPKAIATVQVKLVSLEAITEIASNDSLTDISLRSNSSIAALKVRKTKKHRKNGSGKLYFFGNLLFGAFITKCVI